VFHWFRFGSRLLDHVPRDAATPRRLLPAPINLRPIPFEAVDLSVRNSVADFESMESDEDEIAASECRDRATLAS